MTTPPLIHRLLLDAATSFPYSPNTPSTPSHLRQTTLAWSQTPAASLALTYPPPSRRAAILKYYHPRDAALSLSSHLLKHLALAHHLSLPWSSTPITQERHLHNGRPFYEPGGLDFNVSHHGALAVLACTIAPGVKVGIDVVQVNLEKDAGDVQRNGGWRAWSGIFAEAFSPVEVARIQAVVVPADDKVISSPGRQAELEAALRVFYAYWALKEAYIKMTSEAFMATWLRELEFRGVRVPRVAGREELEEERWAEGETVRGIEVWLRGERVGGVSVELQAVGQTYMVATVVDREGVTVEALRRVSVKEDIEPLVARDGPVAS